MAFYFQSYSKTNPDPHIKETFMLLIFLGSYGAFGNQGGSFGGNRMDSHRGGSNADRDNRVSDQMHADFKTIIKIPVKIYIKS